MGHIAPVLGRCGGGGSHGTYAGQAGGAPTIEEQMKAHAPLTFRLRSVWGSSPGDGHCSLPDLDKPLQTWPQTCFHSDSKPGKLLPIFNHHRLS